MAASANPSAPSVVLDRVLVLTTSARDSSLTCEILGRCGIGALTVSSIEEMCAETDRGAGMILVSEEMLGERAIRAIEALLGRQEPWSDLPIVVVSAQRSMRRAARSLEALGNVTIVDQPVHVRTLVRAVESALRSRRRQYEARNAIRKRDQFLAMLGHELRNPLAAIIFAGEMLGRNEARGRPITKQREIIERQASHLARLVDDLLEVSRVTSGKLRLRRQPLDLVDVVMETVRSFEGTAQERSIAIRAHWDRQPVSVEGDWDRLLQVFTNLLANAIKYAPSGSEIEIRGGVEHGAACVRVRDRGVGIPEEMLDRIFDLFEQVDGSLARSAGGMGIGLTLVRTLVELHGGRVVATSGGVGEGAEFSVFLPLRAAQEEVHRIMLTPGERRRLRVVVVDDNADVCEGLRELLVAAGHEVRTAEEGDVAVRLILSERPDLAIVDIGLPTISGYEVAARVRAELGSSLLLAAMTGYGQPQDRQRSLAAGFDYHLVKPVRLADIDALVALAGDAHESPAAPPPA